MGEVRELDLERAELLPHLRDVEVLIVRLGLQVDRELLDAAPRLRAIVSATTGLDHIDEASARARGIAVLSLRGETTFLDSVRATPEHTWALLLALVRKVVPAYQSVRAGSWDRDEFRGRELAGKTLGLVGCGRVGRLVARYATAFDMRVIAYDPYQAALPFSVTRCERLSDLARQSDILSLHVHLTEETRGLGDARLIQQLPVGAVLINTSRGELIDEQALVDALQSKHLAGAAVDVMVNERDSFSRQRSPLLRYAATHENLLITPHLGGATFESMERTEYFMAQKLVTFLEGAALASPT